MYRRKKLAGERAIPYEDLTALIRTARADGAKTGCGAETVCLLLNCIVRDSLTDGAEPDVVITPLEASKDAPPATRRDAQLDFCVAAAELIAKTEEQVPNGRFGTQHAREIHVIARRVERDMRRLLTVVERERCDRVGAA